jgi:outer membrane immunogenic protein
LGYEKRFYTAWAMNRHGPLSDHVVGDQADAEPSKLDIRWSVAEGPQTVGHSAGSVTFRRTWGRLMKIILAVSVTACAALAAMGFAQAADMQPIYKAQAPAPVAIYNWTGFYVGAHGGWAWTDKRWFLPGTGEVANYGANGALGGLQAGYNWQSGNWVLGAEAQASWSDIRKGVLWTDPEPAPWTDPDPAPVKGGRVVTARTGATVDYFGTIAARGGYAVNNVLLFVKGGGAWTHDVYRAFNANTANETLLASASGTRWGWMVGAGIEYGFAPNWSAKVEFDYLDFGTQRIVLNAVPGVTPATRAFDIAQTISLVKVGINYRFGPAAVVARY